MLEARWAAVSHALFGSGDADVSNALLRSPRWAIRRSHQRRRRGADISPSNRAAFSRADMATLVSAKVSAMSVSHRSRSRSKSARAPAILASRQFFSASSVASSVCIRSICAFKALMSVVWVRGERAANGVYWISARSTMMRTFPSLPGLRGSRCDGQLSPLNWGMVLLHRRGFGGGSRVGQALGLRPEDHRS